MLELVLELELDEVLLELEDELEVLELEEPLESDPVDPPQAVSTSAKVASGTAMRVLVQINMCFHSYWARQPMGEYWGLILICTTIFDVNTGIGLCHQSQNFYFLAVACECAGR